MSAINELFELVQIILYADDGHRRQLAEGLDRIVTKLHPSLTPSPKTTILSARETTSAFAELTSKMKNRWMRHLPNEHDSPIGGHLSLALENSFQSRK